VLKSRQTIYQLRFAIDKLIKKINARYLIGTLLTIAINRTGTLITRAELYRTNKPGKREFTFCGQIIYKARALSS